VQKLAELQLSIIIVNYNVKYFLEQCLFSVLAAVRNIEAEIIVIDNASNDESCDFLRNNFSSIKLICLKENIGFGRANNIALKVAKGKYILFLNPDTIVQENILEDLISFMDQSPEVGAAGLRMIDGSGTFLPESKRSFPTPLNSFFKLSGLASVFPRSKKINRYALADIDEYAIAEVEVLSGAFFFSTRSILQKLNGFDEDFFMYGEDIDLSFRIRREGYKIFYFGNKTIIHFKGESSREKDLKYIRSFYGAMEIFIKKHYQASDRKWFQSMLKAGVYSAALLNILKNYTKKLIKKRLPINVNSFSLMGDQRSVMEAEKIIQLHFPEADVTVADIDKTGVDKTNIVFCLGTVSYATTIAFIDKNKTNYRYFFHAKNSASIIGSPLKNESGIAISNTIKQ